MAKRSVGPSSWLLAIVVLLCLIVYARSCSGSEVTPYAAKGSDLIFADQFGDEPCDGSCGSEGGEPLCTPVAPYYPPYVDMGGPVTLAGVFAPNPIGSALSQVKVSGGTWEGYEFGASDLPSALVEWFADTSNIGGGGAVGADARHYAVSECAGDFRPVSGCSGTVGEGPFLYTNFGPPVVGVCNLDPAKRYFFNTNVGPAPCNEALGRNLCGWRVAVLPR